LAQTSEDLQIATIISALSITQIFRNFSCQKFKQAIEFNL